MKSIGMIGLGLLGSAIAERLQCNDFSVVGYDQHPEALQRFADGGGTAVHSAADVFSNADIVILSLPDSKIVRQMLEVTGSFGRCQLMIDTTTGAPEDAQATAAFLLSSGVWYLDATIAGSSDQVRRSEGVVMVGGPVAAWECARPILACFSRHQFHTGENGTGATFKLIVNLVLGLNRAVLAEGLHLAKACHLDLTLVLEVLKSGAAYSRAMDTKGARMIEQDFVPQARLDQHWKDVGLILQMAKAHDACLPLSTVHNQLLKQASECGWGALDNSAIIRVFDVFRATSNSE